MNEQLTKPTVAQRIKAGRERREALEAENARLKALVEAGGAPPQADEAAKLPQAARTPQPPQPSEHQCVYCGVRFEDLEQHQALVHGKLPDQLRPAGGGDLRPGTIVQPTDGGMAYKVRWTREQLERDCNNWDGDPNKMHWETVDPSDLGLPTSHPTWNGITYDVIAGRDNRVPNVIAGDLRQSRRDTQNIFKGSAVGSVLASEEAAV